MTNPKLSHRDVQVKELTLMLEEENLPECILVQGVAGTGKTMTTEWVLKTTNIPHAFINCVEVYNPRLLFQSAVDQLATLKDVTAGRCDTISDFLFELSKLVGNMKTVIVLKNVEKLRDEGNLLSVFTRLQELTNVNVCSILETRLDWSKLRPSQDIAAPLSVHFTQYTREELASLVGSLLDPKPAIDYGEQFKHNYGSLLLSVFYSVTRSLEELLHIARLNYEAFVKPIIDEECKITDTKKLWFNIEPELKKCLSTVHLREIASKQLTLSLKDLDTDRETDISTATGPTITNAGRITIELPFYSKFLLIAAFLASYNPAKTDKRFFQKHHGKQRKTSASIRSKERMNSQLTGPKTFPLERMMAIFYNIVEEKVNPTASIYSQLTSLTNLELLTAMGHDMMDQPKYKCNVDLNFIRTVAKPLQFDIYKYLYDQC